MGCLHSKKDQNPNRFRVINIDEHKVELCSGEIEVTAADLTLHREKNGTTVWPLHSLRRYGFEEELFSFESGRRCETGEGIYAFKCKRASDLFRLLQTQIQLRNVSHDSTSNPESCMNPSPQGRQTLQATVVHRSSIDNGQPDNLRPVNNGNISANGLTGVERNANHILRSSSSDDILEVMPLYPHSQTSTNHASNVYQLRDYKKEHNNNQEDPVTDSVHADSNDISRDLAILRITLRQEGGLFQIKDDEESYFIEDRRYANTGIPIIKNQSKINPAQSSNSEQYAQLSLKQKEKGKYYINFKRSGSNLQDMKKKENIPSTPATPGGKQVEYCNLSLGPKQECNTYTNLSLSEQGENLKSGKQAPSFEPKKKLPESDKQPKLPEEELEVNYAVLDIDVNKEILKTPREIVTPPSQSCSSPKNDSIALHTSQRSSYLVPQCSMDNTPMSNESAPTPKCGYTTIDFDKTVALTSVAADAVDADAVDACPRKMRHNSCNIVCSSPNNVEKNKNNN